MGGDGSHLEESSHLEGDGAHLAVAGEVVKGTEGEIEEVEEVDDRHAYFRAMDKSQEEAEEGMLDEDHAEEEEEVESPFECAAYIGPSSWIEGIGIIAGKDFGSDEPIDFGVGIPVPNKLKKIFWQLDNYAFASEETGISLAMIGITMLFNHRSPANTAYYYDIDDHKQMTETLDQPYTTHYPIYHLTSNSTHIQKGEEIFTKYGDGDKWFLDRGIPLISNEDLIAKNLSLGSSSIISDKQLAENYHCLGNVYIAQSELPFAGQGVFAARKFAENETVTVSPVLALPRFNVGSLGSASLLQNYCIAELLSEVCLLPIGPAGLTNHGAVPNVVMEWHQWPTGNPNDLHETLGLNVTALLTVPFSKLYLRYRALMPIYFGEEILLSYGSGWLDDWTTYLAHYLEYLEEKLEHNEKVENGEAEEEDIDDLRYPLFRSFIAPPSGLFPTHWQLDGVLFDQHVEAAAFDEETIYNAFTQGRKDGRDDWEEDQDSYYNEETEEKEEL